MLGSSWTENHQHHCGIPTYGCRRALLEVIALPRQFTSDCSYYAWRVRANCELSYLLGKDIDLHANETTIA